MSERIIGRLQTPADENGVRIDVHPITDASAVIYDDDNTVRDKIDRLTPTISKNKPATPGWWIQPLIKETAEGDLILDQLPVDEVTGKIKIDEVRDAVIIDSNKIIVDTEKPDKEGDFDKIWAQEISRDSIAPDGAPATLLGFKRNPDGSYVGDEKCPYNYDGTKLTISEEQPDHPGLWLQDLGRETVEDE